MITADDRFTDVSPRITREDCYTLLVKQAETIPDDARQFFYDAMVNRAIDPLFGLGIWFCESGFSQNPRSVNVRYGNHNPGNLRNPPPVAPSVETDRGGFLTFPTWQNGIDALGIHLSSPLYHEKTIRDTIRMYAPVGDGNDPNAYIERLLDFMNRNVSAPVNVPTESDIGYPVTIDLVGVTGPPRDLAAVEWFTVHDGEGGYESVINTLTNNPNASAHAVIAHDGRLTYMVPIEYTAWHPGNDAFAAVSIGVEQEGYADARDGGYPDAQYRSMAAFYRWCVRQGCPIPAEYIGRVDADGGCLPDVPGILGHADVPDCHGGWGGSSHHTDPGPSYDYGRLIDDVRHGGNGGGGKPPDGGVTTVAFLGGTADYTALTGDGRAVRVHLPRGDAGSAPIGTGVYIVGHGFLDRWAGTDLTAATVAQVLTNAVQRDGWPLSGEFGYNLNGTAVTVQVFERAVYTWDGAHVDALDLGRSFMHAHMPQMPPDVWRG